MNSLFILFTLIFSQILLAQSQNEISSVSRDKMTFLSHRSKVREYLQKQHIQQKHNRLSSVEKLEDDDFGKLDRDMK